MLEKARKINIPKHTTIGKKCEDDPEMMYPNPNFLTYFPDAELPAVLEKAKAKYEAEKETLAELIKVRNEIRKEELREAVIKSEHTYAEIMAFIKSTESQEE